MCYIIDGTGNRYVGTILIDYLEFEIVLPENCFWEECFQESP